MSNRLACALLACGLGRAALADDPAAALVRAQVEARLSRIAVDGPGVVAVAAVDLTSGERFGLNDELASAQGSAIKIPILMEVFKQAHQGALRLEDRITIERAGTVAGSGVLQHFQDGGSALSLHDLCVLMIVLSDNSATNLLIDRVGTENVNRTLAALGLEHTRLRRKMMDSAASARGDENTSSPAEAIRILQLLHGGRFVSAEISKQILAILSLPKDGDLRHGVPAEIPMAFKSGSVPGVATEWVIVSHPERPYAVVVMQSRVPPAAGDASARVFRELSELFYAYFAGRERFTPFGVSTDPTPWN